MYRIPLAALSVLFCLTTAQGQSLGNAGTIDGQVLDPSGAAVSKATVNLHNPVTQYQQTVESADDGSFHLTNIPPNSYHLEITAQGFATFSQEIVIRNSVRIPVKATLAVASAVT